VKPGVKQDLPTASIDHTDVQGLVRFAHARMTEACYLTLRIRDAAAARAWCAAAPVTTAEYREHPPEVALQVAFTSAGLRSLGVPGDVVAGFSAEFLSGMAGDENRSRRLGDVGANAPAAWPWGGPGSIPDVLVMLFANPGKLEGWKRTVQDGAWDAAFELMQCLDTSDLDGYEPFGFKDGLSQPEIDWDGKRDVDSPQIAYGNLVAAGEFLLGYPNEYGKYTDRPLLDSADPLGVDLPAAADAPAKKDVGRNGTYLVLRVLEQDVRGFWKFLDGPADSNPNARQQLAESMVGRTMEGQPLAQSEDGKNRFTFDDDPAGTRCPLGAHIRRANPRNTDYPNRPSGVLTRLWSMLGFASKGIRADLMSATRFHRILRRGREYGPGLTPEQAVQSAAVHHLDDPKRDDPKRGLHFICLNANIARQFEFVQSAWLMSTKFDGLSGESDPLMGNRATIGDGHSTANFTIPRELDLRRCVTGLPQFVMVRGGAYFFLPGIRALRYFSRAGE
jgi:deferrochelatase/peroxidase EfeB